MRFDTRAIHFAQDPDPATGAFTTPIHQTSTFVQKAPRVHKGFDYSRTNNPTRRTLERVLASLEGVEHCAAFASGLAAENAVLQALLSPGDHVITTDDVYGGTFRLLDAVYARKGCSFSTVDLSDARALDAAFRPTTRLVWLETPTNPRLRITDIAKVCRAAHARGVIVVVDNTFASPVNQLPFDLGADLVVHSATKYLSGHSDVIQGAVLAREASIFEPIHFLQNATGAVPSPFDCWLTLRGLKTLSLRVARHNANAQTVAEFLAGHPAVARIHYPGLSAHPGHAIAKRQMTGFGGVVSLEPLGSPEAIRAFVSHRRFFKLGESLGGVKSLVCHPATMTHASIPAERRRALGLSDSLVRLSVGIEDARDLIDDLEQGLAPLSSRRRRRAVVRRGRVVRA
ncbi:MAG: PLP-dependent transferase [Planctomycetes bacterium]|nr:PLP-dependent transferase [Planctomycetota bacterium]MBI3845753.1 PLP-dependent transferase [Planctomycetota bacterium]